LPQLPDKQETVPTSVRTPAAHVKQEVIHFPPYTLCLVENITVIFLGAPEKTFCAFSARMCGNSGSVIPYSGQRKNGLRNLPQFLGFPPVMP